MFGIDLTEEEQAQRLREWFRSNFIYIILGVVSVFGAFGGYNYLQSEQASDARRLSEIFSSLLVYNNQTIDTQDIDSKARAEALVQTEEYVDLLQAIDNKSYQARMAKVQYARMLLFNQSDFDTIKSALGDSINDSNQLVAAAAKLMLANAAWANDKNDLALELLKGDLHPAVVPLADELAGDIHLAAGNRTLAAAAYKQAVDSQMAASQLLRAKLAWTQDPQDLQSQQDEAAPEGVAQDSTN